MDYKRFVCVFSEATKGVAQKNGPETLRFYHGPKHTSMVVEFFAQLARRAGFDTERVLLGVLAAGGHDWEQGLGPGKNETESTRLMAESMRRQDYPEADIEFVSGMILGTVVSWGQEGVMIQAAEKMDNYAAKLLADADLCAIGAETADFADMAYKMMAELAKKPLDEMTADEVVRGWVDKVNFMTGRRFLTKEANALMGEQLEKNLVYARKMAGM